MNRLEQWISIAPDGSITARSGKVEYGQGIRTGFAIMVASELAIDPSQVRVELGETDTVPWDMGTVGSMSTATDGQQLRAAASLARQELIQRASTQMNVDVSNLRVEGGFVIAPDARCIAYADLVRDEPLSGEIPDNATEQLGMPFSKPQPCGRIEARAIVTGHAKYAADVHLPGLLHGRVIRPPSIDSRLETLDDRIARQVPGFVAVVRDGDFVGVVAARRDAAEQACDDLQTTWSKREPEPRQGFTGLLHQIGDVDHALSRATRIVRSEYHLPHIAHASILPQAAVADVRATEAHLHVSTQRPFALREQVAALLGLAAEAVHVHPQTMSGLYGRGNIEGASLEAARLSRAVGTPVLVEWSRKDEFRHSPARPKLDCRMEGGLDLQGNICAWRSSAITNPYIQGPNRFAPETATMSAGRGAVPPYRMPAAQVSLRVEDAAFQTAAFRSLGAGPNVFAVESFMDELANAAGRDPVAFRLDQLRDGQLIKVLETVSQMSGWGPSRPAGMGVACAIYHGTYIAQVAKVSVTAASIRIEHVWCAVDAGLIVNPDAARNQIEGGIQQGASCALLEKLKAYNDSILTSRWKDYRIAHFSDAIPAIDIAFIGDTSRPPCGLGEPGIVPIAPAIANAIFDACGRRLRTMPFSTTLNAGS